MMDNRQIEQVLFRDKITKPYFVGCFSADKMPLKAFFPYCFVANTLPSYSTEPLGHWVSFFVLSPSVVYYFDSLAQNPVSYMKKFLKNFKYVVFNEHAFQSAVSSICGYYAIYFLVNICRKDRFSNICKELENIKIPDLYIYHFVSHRYKLKLPLIQ